MCDDRSATWHFYLDSGFNHQLFCEKMNIEQMVNTFTIKNDKLFHKLKVWTKLQNYWYLGICKACFSVTLQNDPMNPFAIYLKQISYIFHEHFCSD